VLKEAVSTRAAIKGAAFMKRLFAVVLAVSVFLVLPAVAGTGTFTNGGFEDNSFNGWTTGGGYWYGSTQTPSNYLPGGSQFYSGQFQAHSGIVGIGTDPISGLPTVYNGSHAARVNDSTPNYDVSVISQTVNNYTDSSIYFAWAAVLESSHSVGDSDNFSLALTDDTTNAILYSVSYDSAQSSTVGLFHENSNWYYTDWQVQQLDVSGSYGHDITLTLMGSDCPYGGHGGYVYLDGFGGAPPVQSTPEPASLLLAASGLGMLAIRRRRNRK
jgi:MYXO-CTERM domain-containing protein